VLICDEEGAVYPNPRQIRVQDDLSIHHAALCPVCSSAPLGHFLAATADQIQAAGFRPGEYV
jgi:hypothetical protein